MDDEVRLLDSFRRSLGVARPGWDVVTAESGQEALARLQERPFEVLVTDMQMPGMDGAAVLRQARRLAPGTVRILLSGHAGRERILACEGFFHQFLGKPVSPGGLLAVRDSLDLGQAGPGAVRARQLVAGLERLPSLPRWHQAMADHLQQDGAALSEVATIIRHDLGLASKVLKLVNSPYLASDLKVADLSQAAELLSLDLLKAAVLRHGVAGLARELAPAGVDLEQLWAHSFQTATAARALALACGASPRAAEESFTAGLLHDLGRVVLASEPELDYQEVLQQNPLHGAALCALERSRYGTDHAELGAELLNLWGLDRTICEAIGGHHRQPMEPPAGALPIGLILQVADAWTSRLPGSHLFADGGSEQARPGTFEAWLRLLEGGLPSAGDGPVPPMPPMTLA